MVVASNVLTAIQNVRELTGKHLFIWWRAASSWRRERVCPGAAVLPSISTCRLHARTATACKLAAMGGAVAPQAHGVHNIPFLLRTHPSASASSKAAFIRVWLLAGPVVGGSHSAHRSVMALGRLLRWMLLAPVANQHVCNLDGPCVIG